jgi:hypothetical protein
MAKNKNGYGKGTFIDTKMFLSKAFFSLGERGSAKYVSSVSAQLLICFLGKRQFGKVRDRNGNKKRIRIDENRFTFTYKELASKPHNLTIPRARRGLDELLAKGFIEIVDPGGAYEKHKAIYALVDDWKIWKPDDAPIRVRGKYEKRGFQGRGLGAVKKSLHTPTLPTHTHADVTHPTRRTHPPTLPTPQKPNMEITP